MRHDDVAILLKEFSVGRINLLIFGVCPWFVSIAHWIRTRFCVWLYDVRRTTTTTGGNAAFSSACAMCNDCEEYDNTVSIRCGHQPRI